MTCNRKFQLLYMKLVTVDVSFFSDFGFNCKIRIYKEQSERETLELNAKFTCFGHAYLLELTVT